MRLRTGIGMYLGTRLKRGLAKSLQTSRSVRATNAPHLPLLFPSANWTTYSGVSSPRIFEAERYFPNNSFFSSPPCPRTIWPIGSSVAVMMLPSTALTINSSPACVRLTASEIAPYGMLSNVSRDDERTLDAPTARCIRCAR